MTPTELHDAAMGLAEDGDRLRHAAEHKRATEVFARALDLERQAAEAETTEPSRGILFRSAAWLALEAMDAREAERLAATGLAGRHVNPRVAEELRAVMEDARVRLHRSLPAPSAVSRLTVQLEGPEVGFGEADPVRIVPRILAMNALVYRTAERQGSRVFRKKGPADRALQARLMPRMQFAPGSLVMHLVLGGPQVTLWEENANLIEHLITCLAAAHRPDELKRLIPAGDYRENFLALAQSLGPDGQHVSSVQIGGSASGRALGSVALPRAMPLDTIGGRGTAGVVEVEGELRAADETKRARTIGILKATGEVVQIIVSDNLLEDIVRPHYGRRVRITAVPKGGKLRMTGVPTPLDE